MTESTFHIAEYSIHIAEFARLTPQSIFEKPVATIHMPQPRRIHFPMTIDSKPKIVYSKIHNPCGRIYNPYYRIHMPQAECTIHVTECTIHIDESTRLTPYSIIHFPKTMNSNPYATIDNKKSIFQCP